MTADALHEWLLSDGIKEQLALVTRATAALELGTLQPAEELSDQLDALDWERLLLAGSMLARSNKRPPIEAALRIALLQQLAAAARLYCGDVAGHRGE